MSYIIRLNYDIVRVRMAITIIIYDTFRMWMTCIIMSDWILDGVILARMLWQFPFVALGPRQQPPALQSEQVDYPDVVGSLFLARLCPRFLRSFRLLSLSSSPASTNLITIINPPTYHRHHIILQYTIDRAFDCSSMPASPLTVSSIRKLRKILLIYSL